MLDLKKSKIKLFDDDEFFEDEEVKKLSKTTLPDPELLDYFNFLSQRIIFINDYIDDELTYHAMQIITWNKKDQNFKIEERIPIKIYINTNGGSLGAVMNFIDVIKLSKTPVYTIAMSKGYSAGGLLLMSGHKRFVFANTSVLIHDGSTGAWGDTGKVIDSLEFTKEQEARLRQYILSNTIISPEMYEKNYRRDWFMFSEDIIKYSVADVIITDLDQII